MCTAVSIKFKDHYFGRNLDYELDFGESIIITPRNFPFRFRNGTNMENHLSMIGMAITQDNYPLYFDATNEAGLSIAGLNFPDNAYYFEISEQKENIAPFELIPWFLCKYKTVEDCRNACQNLQIVSIPFSTNLSLSPLHWIVADEQESIVIESTREGLRVYDNPHGVLTNNPPFPYHLHNICNYINISPREPVDRFSGEPMLKAYSRGMGAIGLPGDNSSASRFVRAAFTKLNSRCDNTEESSVTQFFHILNSVYQVDGCTAVGDLYEKTIYSSCCNTAKGIYYYTTYENPQVTSVHLNAVNLNDTTLTIISLNKTPQFITSL